MNNDGKYRILSLDGGGIRGIVTLELLDQLTQQVKTDWLSAVDLIAGTSTGGIIALGLADDLPLDEIKRRYKELGESIFYSDLPRPIRYVKNIFTTRYDNRPLAKAIEKQLGSKKLGDLKRKVLISSFDLQGRNEKIKRWKAKFFHNLEGTDNGPTFPKSDWNKFAKDIALYTASAPVYFPSADGFIDGGVVANNPCMVALAQTQDDRYFDKPPRIPEQVVILSIGTGENLKKISGTGRLTWGFGEWISPFRKPSTPLLSLMMDGDTGVAEYQCEQILGKNFCRVQVPFDEKDSIELDQAGEENILKMENYVNNFRQGNPKFQRAVNWIRAKWL